MFAPDVLVAYLAAVLVIVAAPGPDNILLLGRALSQGRLAGAVSAAGSALGIMVHSVAAALGLTLIVQTSPLAFWIVKLAGAAYLVWLGIQALRSRSFISFAPASQAPLRRVFAQGLFTNVLNPKVGLFVVAFMPQFVEVSRDALVAQLLVLGAIYAIATLVIFTVLGAFAAPLARGLAHSTRAVAGLNIGAGLVFVGAGLSILTLENRK